MTYHPAALACSAITAMVVAALLPSPARACGGCFSGQPSTVEAHRMALLIDDESTVLWDQFEYSGAPEDFVWVLPVMGTDDVQIELADDIFFQQLTQLTQVQLFGPSLGGGGGGGGRRGCGASDVAPSAFGPESSPVQIYAQDTVGPYETVVIGSDDPLALIHWLQERDYPVADDMLPVIGHYVQLGANFVALRLSPEAGVQRMVPVRVTCPEASTLLPLRMIAAGIDAEVSLELFVFADERYQADNFANATIDTGALRYDVDSATYNYDALADEALGQNEGNTWLTEFARRLQDDFEIDQPIFDPSGTTPQRATDDWATVLAAYPQPYLTRMRAVLPRTSLDRDLQLGPGPTRDVSEVIQVFETTTASAGFPPMLLLVAPLLWVAGKRRRH